MPKISDLLGQLDAPTEEEQRRRAAALTLPPEVAGVTPQGQPIPAPKLPAPEPITARPSAPEITGSMAGQMVMGALGPAVGEAAALKLMPGLGQRTVSAGLGRIGGAGAGGAALGALTGDPAGGALQGLTAGAVGEGLQWTGARAKESFVGGPYGRLANFVNGIGKITRLGNLIESPRQEGAKAYSLFREQAEGGSAKASKNPVDVFDRKIYEPVKAQVDAAFPPDGIELPTMNRLIAQKKIGAIPSDALNRNDYPRRANVESEYLKFKGPQGLAAALQQGKFPFMKAPYEWTFKELDDTIKTLNNKGYNPESGDPRGSIPSPEARQDAHQLVEEMHDWLSQNASPKLADEWRQKRNHMLGLGTLQRLLKEVNMPELGGPKEFGKLQAAIVAHQGDFQRAFGPENELQLRQTITRGVSDPKYFDQPMGMHPSGGLSPSGIHMFPHFSLGQTLRPEVIAGSLPQLLKSGLPGALLSWIFGQPPGQENK